MGKTVNRIGAGILTLCSFGAVVVGETSIGIYLILGAILLEIDAQMED